MSIVWNGYMRYYFHHIRPKFTLQTFLLVNAKIQLEQKKRWFKFLDSRPSCNSFRRLRLKIVFQLFISIVQTDILKIIKYYFLFGWFKWKIERTTFNLSYLKLLRHTFDLNLIVLIAKLSKLTIYFILFSIYI